MEIKYKLECKCGATAHEYVGLEGGVYMDGNQPFECEAWPDGEHIFKKQAIMKHKFKVGDLVNLSGYVIKIVNVTRSKKHYQFKIQSDCGVQKRNLSKLDVGNIPVVILDNIGFLEDYS